MISSLRDCYDVGVMTYWQCAVTLVSGRTGEGCNGRERNLKQLKRPHQKNEWYLRWESTMCARKSDEKELLELDNWRRW